MTEQQKILDRLRQQKPRADLIHLAVEQLTTRRDMEQFIREYQEYLRTEGLTEATRTNPSGTTTKSLRYHVERHYGKQPNEERKRLWHEALTGA